MDFFRTPTGIHILFVVLALPPLLVIYKRAGLKPWGALLVVLPVVGFVVSLVALVGQRWPAAVSDAGSKRGQG